MAKRQPPPAPEPLPKLTAEETVFVSAYLRTGKRDYAYAVAIAGTGVWCCSTATADRRGGEWLRRPAVRAAVLAARQRSSRA